MKYDIFEYLKKRKCLNRVIFTKQLPVQIRDLFYENGRTVKNAYRKLRNIYGQHNCRSDFNKAVHWKIKEQNYIDFVHASVVEKPQSPISRYVYIITVFFLN